MTVRVSNVGLAARKMSGSRTTPASVADSLSQGRTGGSVLGRAVPDRVVDSWPELEPRGCEAADADDAYRGVDADASLVGPVHILQIEKQRQLIDDQCGSGAVSNCGRGMATVPFSAAQRDGPEAGEHADPDVVMVKMFAADTIPPPLGPCPALIQ